MEVAGPPSHAPRLSALALLVLAAFTFCDSEQGQAGVSRLCYQCQGRGMQHVVYTLERGCKAYSRKNVSSRQSGDSWAQSCKGSLVLVQCCGQRKEAETGN